MMFIYEQPSLLLIADPAPNLIQEIFNAFAPWSPMLDDIEFINEGKNSEKGVKIKIASQDASFFFGPESCRFTKEGANWADADHITQLLEAALSSFCGFTKIAFQSQIAILSLHIQPATVPFRDILRKAIIGERILALDPEPTTVMAMVVKWPKHRITLDGSATLANGIFVQHERQFEGRVSFEDVKRALSEDQMALFQLLDVTEEANS